MMGDIKYSDFAKLSWDDGIGFLDYFKYLLDSNFCDLEQELKTNLELKELPVRSDDQIIEGALAVSPKDVETKQSDKNYYVSHVACLNSTIKRIFCRELYDTLSTSSAKTETDSIYSITINNYTHVLRCLLFDVEVLFDIFDHKCLKSKKQARTRSCGGIYSNKLIHYLSIHQIIRQSLYGQISCHSFTDIEISSSIAVIRQL